MKTTIRFQDDYPVSVTFKFNQPMPKEGKYGQQFYYGVVDEFNNEAGFYATEKLHNLLQNVGDLKDRRLEIEKKSTENNRSYWVIRENGEDITPSENSVKNISENIIKKDQILEDVADLKLRINELEGMVENLISLIGNQ